MREIKLSKGKIALVDDQDFGYLSQWNWYAQYNGWGKYYAARAGGKGSKIYMHREILKPPKGLYADHIDGNGLNNQRGNLRVATNQQNQINRGRPSNNRTGYKGVSPSSGGRWRARLFIKRHSVNGGCYATKEEAAVAYLKLVEDHFGNLVTGTADGLLRAAVHEQGRNG